MFLLIIGAAAFAGGGGGAKQWGTLFLNYIESLLGPDKPVATLVSLNGISDDIDVVPVACMGAPTALSGDNAGFLPVLSNCSIQAYQSDTKKQLQVVCGVEVGPTNSIVPMYAAATITANGGTCYVLDGDLQGRAVLSLTMLGPYMFNGVNMLGTYYSYVLPLNSLIPPNVLSKETVVISGNTYTVVGMKVPDQYSSPADTESFLGNVIQNAAPDTVLSVVFGGLTAGLLKKNSVEYTPGVYTQICTPNTLTRSINMGEMVIQKDQLSALKLLSEQNAIFISPTGYLNKFMSAGGGTRSDLAVWTVTGDDKTVYNGFFNNETVLITYLNSNNYIDYLTTPNTLGVMVSQDYSIGQYQLYTGECLTNDEIATLFSSQTNPISIPVLLFQLPPSNLLVTSQALNWIQPNKWGLANQFGSPFPSLENIPYISSLTQFVAPPYYPVYRVKPSSFSSVDDESDQKERGD